MSEEKYPKKVKVQCINCDWYFMAEETESIVDCPRCGQMVSTEEDKL